MYFNSLHFVAFFAVVFTAALLLRRRVTARNAMLLAGSYYFYGCWNWRFLGLIILSTVVDYICGLLFERIPPDDRPRTRRRRKLILAVSLVTNLGLLGFFKYYDFFIESAVDLLTAIGLETDLRTLGILLPVGISFYTFQTLSYTIDLYYGKIKTERNLLTFALFVSFFPQLVAGPIERAKNLLPQLARRTEMTWPKFASGFYLMSWGLFKKVVIADNLARIVAEIWAVEDPSGVTVVIGCYAFAFQLYCDFSGYSDIARGAARCMGFELMLNFRIPFFATNITDFWRRWHISLSTWLRDYIYYPLGGSRKGSARNYVNITLTMVASGVWHGAGWPFALMGLTYGLQLCLHKATAPLLARLVHPRAAVTRHLWSLFRVFCTFQLFAAPMIFFRSRTMGKVTEMAGSAWRDPLPATWETVGPWLTTLAWCGGTLLFVQALQYFRKDLDVIPRLPVPLRAIAYAGLMLGILFFGVIDGDAFVYFQF